MPGYGIDEKHLEGLLPWLWAEKLLSKTQNYFLATVRIDGRPHVMPIWGVWMNDRFYPSTMNEPVFSIRPRVVFGQIEKTFTQTATRWIF